MITMDMQLLKEEDPVQEDFQAFRQEDFLIFLRTYLASLQGDLEDQTLQVIEEQILDII